jgi:hypothetical protein
MAEWVERCWAGAGGKWIRLQVNLGRIGRPKKRGCNNVFPNIIQWFGFKSKGFKYFQAKFELNSK